MKFFIVLALLGAAFAEEEVEPVLVAEMPLSIHDMVDFGVELIPESVLREVGYEQPAYDQPPIHYIDENGDIATHFEDTPLDESYARVNLDEYEPVQVVDFAPEAFEGDAPVEAPLVEEPLPIDESIVEDGPVEGTVQIVDNADFDQIVDAVQVVDLPLEEVVPQETNPDYRRKKFPSPLMR